MAVRLELFALPFEDANLASVHFKATNHWISTDG